MIRRTAAAIVALAGLGALPAIARAIERPDVLLVTLDTTRADALGCYGGAAKTPTLDALAARGVRYAHAFTAVPLTLPAHASLMTGLVPVDHGLRANGAGALAPSLPTLAEAFARAGYSTAAVVGSRVLDRRFGLARGFALYDDRMTAERFGEYGYAERDAKSVVDAALAALRARDPSKPLFLWIHFYDAHAPYDPPPDLRGASERANYLGEIAYVDRELARLLAAWSGRSEPWVAVVGDHGEGLGEHGEQRHGLLLHRSTLEVPLILAGPGIASPVVVTASVGTVDLAATLVRLGGIGKGDARIPGDPLPLAERDSNRAAPILHETEFPADAYGWRAGFAVTEGSLRLVSGAKPELFDFVADPGETTDLAAARPNDARRLEKVLRQEIARRPPAPRPSTGAQTTALLRSLGYAAGGTRAAGDREAKDGLPLLAELERANELSDRGDAASAIAILERLVATSPESVPFHSSLAAARLARNDAAGAVSEYQRVIVLAPTSEFAEAGLARALLASGRSDDAVGALERALALDPRFVDARLLRAEIAAQRGGAADEERILREGVAAGAESAAIHTRLAEIALARGDLAGASAELDTATALYPEWSIPWIRRGRLESARNAPGAAERAFRRAVALAPDDPESLFELARFLDSHGGKIEARPILERLAASPNPWAAAARKLLGP